MTQIDVNLHAKNKFYAWRRIYYNYMFFMSRLPTFYLKAKQFILSILKIFFIVFLV